MIIKTLQDEVFQDYKKAAMEVAFPRCTFKCGKDICQNCELARSKDIQIDAKKIVDRYIKNDLTSALICAGLEPFDTMKDLMDIVSELRNESNDDIVVYTGYDKDEIKDKLELLKSYPNIIVKYGRYIPNEKPHYDEILGVNLASDNQYAEKIS